jgi:hypothetical protein
MVNVIHAYLGYKFVATQLMDIASLIKEMSGRSKSINASTHCINKPILCSGNNEVHHISEQVLNSLDGQIPHSAQAFCENAFHIGVSNHIKCIAIFFLLGFAVDMTNGITHAQHRIPIIFLLNTFEINRRHIRTQLLKYGPLK